VKARAPVDLLIAGARLATPRGVVRASLCIDRGRIVKVGKPGAMPRASETINLPSSSLVLPAPVDVHAHLRDLELSHKGDFASETQAAAVGGISFVVDIPNSRPPTLTASAFDAKKQRMPGRIAVDLGLNLGVQGNDEELEKVKDNIAYGEIFVGPSTEGTLVGYGELEAALKIIARTGKVVCIHAEDPALFRDQSAGKYDHGSARPAEAEEEAVSRVLRLNEGIGARLHFCHVSTRRSLRDIAAYKSRKMSVTCEVTPHHLILSSQTYEDLGTPAKMNPPLREPGDVEGVLEGVRSGVVDVIASDHAPHALEEKSLGEPDAPAGVPGFETLVPAVLTHFERSGLSPSTFVRLTSLAPAYVFNVPGKGFGIGRDADLVVVDRKRSKVDPDSFLSKAKYSPFAGMSLRFWPRMTILRGIVIADGGEVVIKDRGRFLSPAGEYDG